MQRDRPVSSQAKLPGAAPCDDPDLADRIAAAMHAVASGAPLPGGLPPAVELALARLAVRLAESGPAAGGALDGVGNGVGEPALRAIDERIRQLDDGALGPARRRSRGASTEGRMHVLTDTLISRLGEVMGRLQHLSQKAAARARTIEEQGALLRGQSATQIDAVQAVLFDLEAVAQQIERNRSLADASLTSVAETSSVTNDLIIGVEEISSAMERITQSSRRIEDVVRKIEQIAQQTEIISINAAIEAARAGDAGRGFVLIASEVRRLAVACRNLATGIGSLTEVSRAAVGTGVEVAERTVAKISSVRAATDRVSSEVGQISDASGEAARTVAALHRAVTTISERAAKNAEVAAALADAAHAQARASGSVAEAAGEVRIDRSMLADLLIDPDEDTPPSATRPGPASAGAPTIELF